MVLDGQKSVTDGRTHGRRQNYIPPTLLGDKYFNILHMQTAKAKFSQHTVQSICSVMSGGKRNGQFYK